MRSIMNYQRMYILGGCYAFTLVLENRNTSLLTDNIKSLRDAFTYTMKRHPFIIHGIAVMPDHLHMLISLPENDSDYATRISLIKSHFTRSIPKQEDIRASKLRHRERGIWQKRFWEHCIRKDADFENQLNYIHFNPVRHGLTDQASQWQYSSIHRYIRQGILTADWGFVEKDKNQFGE
jgi:putative transposase